MFKAGPSSTASWAVLAETATEVWQRARTYDKALESDVKLKTALETLFKVQLPAALHWQWAIPAYEYRRYDNARICSRTQSPVCLLRSEDIMPASDPLFFGCPGGFAGMSANDVPARADTIVFLGARLDLGTTAFQRHTFGEQFTASSIVDKAELDKFGKLLKMRSSGAICAPYLQLLQPFPRSGPTLNLAGLAGVRPDDANISPRNGSEWPDKMKGRQPDQNLHHMVCRQGLDSARQFRVR